LGCRNVCLADYYEGSSSYSKENFAVPRKKTLGWWIFYPITLKETKIEKIAYSVNHFYLPTNALNCIKLRRLKSTCIYILKDN